MRENEPVLLVLSVFDAKLFLRKAKFYLRNVTKRRFWCMRCHKAFTESDSACGRRKRTTVRLREEIGQQACSRPIMHVASQYEVGPRFVQACLEAVASTQLAKRGLSVPSGIADKKNTHSLCLVSSLNGVSEAKP